MTRFSCRGRFFFLMNVGSTVVYFRSKDFTGKQNKTRTRMSDHCDEMSLNIIDLSDREYLYLKPQSDHRFHGNVHLRDSESKVQMCCPYGIGDGVSQRLSSTLFRLFHEPCRRLCTVYRLFTTGDTSTGLSKDGMVH